MRSKGVVFLLTKTPDNPRSELCLKLMNRSRGARLYLSGDGVYHLLQNVDLLPASRIFACKEDLSARGIQAKGNVTVLDAFYEKMIEDIMEKCHRLYTF
jgi:tRNA 2-thiouridine synthesizing protein B